MASLSGANNAVGAMDAAIEAHNSAVPVADRSTKNYGH